VSGEWFSPGANLLKFIKNVQEQTATGMMNGNERLESKEAA